jgi:hypothetical protein
MNLCKSYSELITFKTFEERFAYLKLFGLVGNATFGYDRYLNQLLYRSGQWKSLRYKIIDRDNGCDLGVPGYEISDRITVHHINPITIEDIEQNRYCVYDPDNLISTSTFRTHNAIHFSDESLLPKKPIERHPGDTCPWR